MEHVKSEDLAVADVPQQKDPEAGATFMKSWKRCEGAWTYLNNQEIPFHFN